MLKRTLGRSLLTLLVITGLAGTIEDSSISKKERKHAVGSMKDSKMTAINSVKGLSEAQLSFKTSPESWSVRDCIYHIAASEKMIWSLFEKTMKDPANPEKRSEIKMTDEQVEKIIRSRDVKVKTMTPLEPLNTGYKSLDEAIEDFKAQRGDHIKYMKNSTEDMRNHVAQLPFGWLDCYQVSLFISAHTERHIQQINEVKADPAFPKQ